MASEAQFLASHFARTEALRQRRPCRHRDDDLRAFWETFRTRQLHWQQRLDEIPSRYGRTALRVEADRREALLQLRQLDLELKALRRVCLLGSNETTEADDGGHNVLGQGGLPAVSVPSELPLGDVRLLHAEFCKCQEQLDQIQGMLLPRGKFVFRRYREAWQRTQRGLNEQIARENTTPDQHHELATRAVAVNTFGAIEGISDASVEVGPEGQVTFKSITAAQMIDKSKDLGVLISSPVLQMIHNCTVVLKGSYQGIYLRSVTNSTVLVIHPVDGPVHVTDCHRTTLRLQSQQLRLHDSSDLTCSVRVSAGAILEDCRRVLFRTPDRGALDVKDFNWMKRNLPSPNYAVEEEAQDEGDVANAQAVLSLTELQPAGAREETRRTNQGKILLVMDAEVTGKEQNEDDEEL